MFDLLPGVIAVTGPARRILFWSNGAGAATGWSAADATGRDFAELLRLSKQDEENHAFGQLAEGGAWEGELEIVSRSDSKRILHGTWKCI